MRFQGYSLLLCLFVSTFVSSSRACLAQNGKGTESGLVSSFSASEGTAGPEPLPLGALPAVFPKSGPFCDRFVSECLDGSSFPNIGQAFRGYNLILGDPLNYGGDPGFKGHIFDEAGERKGGVRFGNIAGNDLNRCDGSVRADFIQTSEEFLESIMRSESSRKSFQIGSEVEVTASLSAGVEIPV